MLPRTTRAQRACKRNVANADCDSSCAYHKLIKDVSDLYELSTKESKSYLPAVSARWSRNDIVKYVKLEAHYKPSKDKRVSYLARALDIGAVNTIRVCKVNFACLKDCRISY
jgi:hypothetical protein